jgi:hypothetical protein
MVLHVLLVNGVSCTINGLYPKAARSLFGHCNMTLKDSACAKANYLCVECLKPTGSSYTADKDLDNNKLCVLMKPMPFCTAGKIVNHKLF